MFFRKRRRSPAYEAAQRAMAEQKKRDRLRERLEEELKRLIEEWERSA